MAFAALSVASARSRGESLAGVKVASSMDIGTYLSRQTELQNRPISGLLGQLLSWAPAEGLHAVPSFAQAALAADGFGLFSCALFGRLFIGAARLDFPEDTFTLHLLLQDPEGLIDIVISN